jgi:hypothetical protein
MTAGARKASYQGRSMTDGGACSWKTSVLACVADEDFILQRFTG